MLQKIDETIKAVPIYYGYGTEDPKISVSRINTLAAILKKHVTENFKIRKYRCLGHGCSDKVRIYFISLVFSFSQNI